MASKSKETQFTTLDFVKAKKSLPMFMTSYGAFTKAVPIEKVFPTIGLQNCSEPLKESLEIKPHDILKSAQASIATFRKELRNKYKLNKVSSKDLFIFSDLDYNLDVINQAINKQYFVVKSNKCLLDRDLLFPSGDVCVKKNTDLIKKVTSVLTQASKYIALDTVDLASAVKEFKNLKICFSSTGLIGAWDIATMSMRGITSCMRWPAKQSRALVGSILDPACGLIYITNGKRTSHGTKMLFRAVVRYGVKSRSYDGHISYNEPALLIDKTYAFNFKNGGKIPLNLTVRKEFIKLLREKTKNKIPIVDLENNPPNSFVDTYYTIPSFSVMTNEIYSDGTDFSYWPYRDYDLPYSNTSHNSVSEYFKEHPFK